MANTGLIVTGIILMILGAGGTIFTLPFVEQPACSGQGLFGSLVQLNEENQETCAKNRMFLWGTISLGIIGIGLLVAGATISNKPESKVERSEWICEHCDFKSEREIDLIEHYKEQHADEKNDSYHKKYGEKPLSPETLDILKQRYAKGEITKEEFEQMKKDLEN